MLIEPNEQKMIFNNTQLPDIFFAEYLTSIPGDYLKIYLYLVFLSKYNSDIKINDLSKHLSLPLNTINLGMKYLEETGLVLRTPQGYIITDLQNKMLNELYVMKVETSSEKIAQSAKNKERIQLVQYINNTYFQGVMGPTWYSDIDNWLDKFEFDEQVLITLFDYSFKKGALHKNYVQKVAEAWNQSKIKSIEDLENYFSEQEKIMKIKKEISKKLGKHGNLTQYEEAYIEKWVNDFKYDMDILEIALKRTTFKSNPSFEYLNNIITDWNDRNLRTPTQVKEFLEQRKKQVSSEKELKQKIKQENFEQRNYSDLSHLIKNKDTASNE